MVNGRPLKALVDTGATYSTVQKSHITEAQISDQTVGVVGFSGGVEYWPFTIPLTTMVANQRLIHTFLYSSNAPIPLLGRDLLIKLRASIMCSPKGVTVTFPDGTSIDCSQKQSIASQHVLLGGSLMEMADIYWVELDDTPAYNGVVSLYTRNLPWIKDLAVFLPPIDPLHCTLYYDRNGSDLLYQESFQEMEGHMWRLQGEGIFVGKQGVAALIELTEKQLLWYRMTKTAAPHISLALSPGHEARELGGMTKIIREATDWALCNIAGVLYSKTHDAYWINQNTDDCGTLTQRQVSRAHGRELSDGEGAKELIARQPATLWSQGPTDVGLCDITPITFSIKPGEPLWIPQYRNKPEAEDGIAATVQGLCERGVISQWHSPWNTPICPVKKPGT
ncbi:MAG: retroviral-like aspartic protease family protein, partial [Aeromonas sp.]